MRLLSVFAIAAALASLPALSSPGFAETRIALVIGNGAYQSVPPLTNPANDASAVAAALRRSGFNTTEATDLDAHGMQKATIAFARAARSADVALFYYTGHAFQFNGINYLAPVDTILRDKTDLRRMTRVDQIISAKHPNLFILVLDSCRDNPFAEQLHRSPGSTGAIPPAKGLARLKGNTQHGMIVLYAMQAGKTAEDGAGSHSPFTAAFLRHIESPREIGEVFRDISEDVYNATHSQLPELSLSFIGNFYLNGKKPATE